MCPVTISYTCNMRKGNLWTHAGVEAALGPDQLESYMRTYDGCHFYQRWHSSLMPCQHWRVVRGSKQDDPASRADAVRDKLALFRHILGKTQTKSRGLLRLHPSSLHTLFYSRRSASVPRISFSFHLAHICHLYTKAHGYNQCWFVLQNKPMHDREEEIVVSYIQRYVKERAHCLKCQIMPVRNLHHVFWLICKNMTIFKLFSRYNSSSATRL